VRRKPPVDTLRKTARPTFAYVRYSRSSSRCSRTTAFHGLSPHLEDLLDGLTPAEQQLAVGRGQILPLREEPFQDA
jgi:hypothetical protein